MIQILVLKNGQEVLGECESRQVTMFNDTCEIAHVVKKPHLILMSQQGPILMPWLSYSTDHADGIELFGSDVLLIVTPTEILRNKYIEVTTGLVAGQPAKAAYSGLHLAE